MCRFPQDTSVAGLQRFDPLGPWVDLRYARPSCPGDMLIQPEAYLASCPSTNQNIYASPDETNDIPLSGLRIFS
jgi:hypothetical protein